VDFVDLNKAVLENAGFEVATAFSGREGMDKVKFESPDLILLDLMIEKHDTGFGFSKQIKADPRYKNIPILMISSVADETGYAFSQELDGYWMKTDDFASKPVLAEDLVKRINGLLERAKQA
jgi:two-component system alkaline phosphatase synthesis response regulator PhoP